MQIIAAILMIILNCIVYTAFGSLICIRKNQSWSLPVAMTVGFFGYYGLFAIVCLPIMLTYRPLSLLSKVWMPVVVVIVLAAVALKGGRWLQKAKSLPGTISGYKVFWVLVAVLVAVQLVLVGITYNFTLDAAYYVANVSTSVDTNMINVYDPFTGSWQDHFELRYVFATYSIHDAVICQVFKIPALVQTKTVMSATVVILANGLYVFATMFLSKGKKLQMCVMYAVMIFINLTFITLYTSSNFYMTRTYEGKSIVGNIAVVVIFLLYMTAVRNGMDNNLWVMLFTVCLGTATVSSTANMIIPAQMCMLFVPYIVRHRKMREAYKLLICIILEIVMLLMYVLYVKGYFAIYTYPR